MRIRSLATCLALTTAAMLIPIAADAATPVAASCGATLSTDAYLPGDLSCPADQGLTLVGTVTLDLKNHKLIGTGSKQGTALSVQSGSTPLIKSGAIQGWGAGITFIVPEDAGSASGKATITGVTFAGNDVGVAAGGGGDYDIRTSRFASNRWGIGGVFTGSISVAGSTFQRNDTGAHVDTATLLVSTSRFDHNGTGVACEEAGCTLTTSRFTHNDTGIATRTFGAIVTSNVISNNTTGLDGFVAVGHTVTRNAFTHNKTGVNFLSSGGTLSRNAFTGNDIGFTSSGNVEPDFGATLDRNLFVRGGDGIHVEDGGNGLQGNTAVHNTGWGIFAPGSSDLGSNHAFRNGNSPQCVGVAC